jgi:hypothetical protein
MSLTRIPGHFHNLFRFSDEKQIISGSLASVERRDNPKREVLIASRTRRSQRQIRHGAPVDIPIKNSEGSLMLQISDERGRGCQASPAAMGE